MPFKDNIAATSLVVTAADRRKQVAELYLGGKSQTEIARQFGVSQPLISKDLKIIQKEWLKSMLMDFNMAKSRELARIDHLEREYWDEYRNSKGKHAKQVIHERNGRSDDDVGQLSIAERETTIEERTGDPRYLEGVRWCIEQRLKIFGVYSQQAVTASLRMKMGEGQGITEIVVEVPIVGDTQGQIDAGDAEAMGEVVEASPDVVDLPPGDWHIEQSGEQAGSQSPAMPDLTQADDPSLDG